MIHVYSPAHFRTIALQARVDFENDEIPSEDILRAAQRYGFNQNRLELLKRSLESTDQFPYGYCTAAAVILKARCDEVRLEGPEHETVIVEGGYNVGGSESDEPHNFLAVGKVGRFASMAALSEYIVEGNEIDTVFIQGIDIGDITADQFRGPAVYVGPLMGPWVLSQQSPYDCI